MAALTEDVQQLSELDLRVFNDATSLAGGVVAEPLSGADVSILRDPEGGSDEHVAPVSGPEVVVPETVSAGDRLRAPPVSPNGLPKKLLILDVNGFLIDTMFKFDTDKPNLREHDGTVNNFLSEL